MSSLDTSDSSRKKFGKVGLTGLVQLQHPNALSSREQEMYNIYYAKNQSLWFDIEILMKTFSQQ
jgi:lipopolysaccharide/colanic/teichoic acid biosynthesis glycosyltransferase